MKKKILTIICIILGVIILGIISFKLYSYLRIKYAKIEVTLVDDMTLEFNDKKKSIRLYKKYKWKNN